MLYLWSGEEFVSVHFYNLTKICLIRKCNFGCINIKGILLIAVIEKINYKHSFFLQFYSFVYLFMMVYIL